VARAAFVYTVCCIVIRKKKTYSRTGVVPLSTLIHGIVVNQVNSSVWSFFWAVMGGDEILFPLLSFAVLFVSFW
jgi:hypothetical protein